MATDSWAEEWREISRVYRLAPRRYAVTAAGIPDVDTALNGAGGLHVGGRWHRRGQRVVYTSSSRTGATLERAVHLDAGLYDADPTLAFMRVGIPAGVSRQVITPAMLERLVALSAGGPPDWRVPDHPVCVQAGASWLAARVSCLLVVPSAVVPGDANVLINPEHPDMAMILEANRQHFALEPYIPDERLAKVLNLSAAGAKGAGTS